MQVSVECRIVEEGTGVVMRRSRLSLVDLAGSERQKAAETEGDRLKEAQVGGQGHALERRPALVVVERHGVSKQLAQAGQHLLVLGKSLRLRWAIMAWVHPTCAGNQQEPVHARPGGGMWGLLGSVKGCSNGTAVVACPSLQAARTREL